MVDLAASIREAVSRSITQPCMQKHTGISNQRHVVLFDLAGASKRLYEKESFRLKNLQQIRMEVGKMSLKKRAYAFGDSELHSGHPLSNVFCIT